MALEDALEYLNRSLTDPITGYITQEDMQLVIKQIYADRAPGPVGGQGARGPIGIQGVPGSGGSIGPIGPLGAKGDTGVAGAAGTAGVTGPQGPPGVAAVLTLTASPATPVNTNGQMYVVTDPTLGWLPAGSSLGDLVVYSTNKWVNLGSLGVQMIPSTISGNRIHLDTAGRPYHLDEDHVIFETRVDATAVHNQIGLAVTDRMPINGGTFLGRISGPATTAGDSATTYSTKGYVDARLPATGGVAADLTVGTLDVVTLNVDAPVMDLRVGTASSDDHALSLGDGKELFSSVNHTHPVPTGVVTTAGGDVMEGPLIFGSDAVTVSLTPDPRFGLALIPAEDGQLTEHMLYFNSSKRTWVFGGPTVTQVPGVEFMTPPRSAISPMAMDQVANREFVEKMDALTLTEMKSYLVEQMDTLEAALTERLLAQIRVEVGK